MAKIRCYTVKPNEIQKGSLFEGKNLMVILLSNNQQRLQLANYLAKDEFFKETTLVEKAVDKISKDSKEIGSYVIADEKLIRMLSQDTEIFENKNKIAAAMLKSRVERVFVRVLTGNNLFNKLFMCPVDDTHISFNFE